MQKGVEIRKRIENQGDANSFAAASIVIKIPSDSLNGCTRQCCQRDRTICGRSILIWAKFNLIRCKQTKTTVIAQTSIIRRSFNKTFKRENFQMRFIVGHPQSPRLQSFAGIRAKRRVSDYPMTSNRTCAIRRRFDGR